MKKLAIVIPAYKSCFIERTLESIASQTCKDFTLYIGDDNSPDDLQPIVSKFVDRMDIVYRKFDENLGGRNLVAQWNRCVEMTAGEEWVWLFSDDDIMDKDCVRAFYNAEALSEADVFHFTVDVIDENGEKYKGEGYGHDEFPEVLSSIDFAKARLSFKLDSFVVENIFRRERYDSNGGFVNFDLAWCSDDASWVAFASRTGIRSIRGPRVKWRVSSSNITPDRSFRIRLRKLKSVCAYLKFLNGFFHDVSLIPYYTNYFIHALVNALL